MLRSKKNQSDSVEAGEFDSDQLTGFARSRFIAEDSKATIKNVALVAKLAAFLVPLFLLLDVYVYPRHFASFFYLRVGCTAMILVVLYCTRTKWARRAYRLFAMSVPLISAIFISLMIQEIGDPGTPYYAGLTLCLVAIGALLHWTYQEAALSSLLIMLMYLLACGSELRAGMDPEIFGYFINNCLFLGTVGFIVIIGSYTHHGVRISEFLSRMHLRRYQMELEGANSELKSTLHALQEAESQLIQADKMAFLGQMSAGVIHEIGNPLNFSNQALFILRKKMLKSGLAEETHETVGDMQEGLDRIKGIISELREFSHSGSGHGSEYQITESVESALSMLGKQIEAANVEVEKNVDAQLKIHGIKNQITQVVVNLIHNAVQAMEFMKSGSRTLEINAQASLDNCISLTIADSGPGIPAEHAAKLFDPFFTTKDPGEGTGLGLSVCYRIIEAHGGSIRVDCPPEQGTIFTLVLPSSFPVADEKQHA